MRQEFKEKARPRHAEDVEIVETIPLEASGSIDDILADIDDVLEENAYEFVRSYIQAGGQ